jgi:hypothetical protein
MTRKRLAPVGLSMLALSLRGVPAVAMAFQVQGDELVMSGPVNGSECADLGSVLEKAGIKTVVLGYSSGGDADTGYCVGALIRRKGLSTVIRGTCVSSCSRMWLGGVSRTLDGPYSRVGLHGNYDRNGMLLPGAPDRLRSWIPSYAPVDRQLMEQWINLGRNTQMMFFYNDKAELCYRDSCTPIPGRNALNAGLATK